jgi:hypothetical protein
MNPQLLGDPSNRSTTMLMLTPDLHVGPKSVFCLRRFVRFSFTSWIGKGFSVLVLRAGCR